MIDRSLLSDDTNRRIDEYNLKKEREQKKDLLD